MDAHERYSHANDRSPSLTSSWAQKNVTRMASKEDRQAAFLVALRELRNTTAARKATNTPKGTLAKWRAVNPVFVVEMELAMEGK